MTTIDDIDDANKRKAEAEKRNPLLKLSLGELVREMQVIAVKDPNVLSTPEMIEKAMQQFIPQQRDFLIKESMKNYEYYMSLIEDLKRREEEYKSYKQELRF